MYSWRAVHLEKTARRTRRAVKGEKLKYYVFKTPRKKGDQPLEVLNYEPGEFIIAQKAIKYGPIVIVGDDTLRKEAEENS